MNNHLRLRSQKLEQSEIRSNNGKPKRSERDKSSENLRAPELQKASCSCGGGCPSCQSVNAFDGTRDTGKKVFRAIDSTVALGASQKDRSPTSNATPYPIIGLNTHGNSGTPLSKGVREFMEPRLGTEFADVRIHTDSMASDSAKSLGAKAYTVGSDIVFKQGEFDPQSPNGRGLIAHELTHVRQNQQSNPPTSSESLIGHKNSRSEREADSAASAIKNGIMPTRGGQIVRGNSSPLNLKPDDAGSTEAIHDQIVEDYRRAHNLPPNGIDQFGNQIGPTDSEIRFGGLLLAWFGGVPIVPIQAAAPAPTTAGTPAAVPSQPATTAPITAGVAAPTTAPTIAAKGKTNVVSMCKGATDVTACRIHKNYVINLLPQMIQNIGNVKTPYSKAIFDLYNSVLTKIQASPPPTMNGKSTSASAGPITINFGSVSHTFTKFELSLQQRQNAANGQALSIGGPVAFVILNEFSNDALLGKIDQVEETIIHETIHIFTDIVEKQNKGRAKGSAAAQPNLDRSSYAKEHAALEVALTPFVSKIRSLPSFTGSPPRFSLADDLNSTAKTFLNEAIARVEAGIFVKLRAGQGFTKADLSGLTPFYRADAYWSPTPPTAKEIKDFIKANQSAIDTAIKPIIHQAQEQYLKIRP